MCEKESRRGQEAKLKKAPVEKAERLECAVEDESQLLDDMFNFIDQQTESSSEGAAPAAFKISMFEG